MKIVSHTVLPLLFTSLSLISFGQKKYDLKELYTIMLSEQPFNYKEQLMDSLAQTGNYDKSFLAIPYQFMAGHAVNEGKELLCYHYMNKSIAFAKASGHNKQIKNTLVNMGLLLTRHKRYVKALKILNKSLKIPGENQSHINAYSQLLDVYNALGEHEKCIELFQRILPYYEKTDDYHGQARSYNTVAIAYNELDSKKYAAKAKYFYRKTIKLLELAGSEALTHKKTVYSNIGSVFFKEKKYDSALYYYNLAKALAIKEKQKLKYADFCNNIGYVYVHKNKLDSAALYFNHTLSYCKDAEPAAKARYYDNIGKLFLKTANLKKSQSYLEKSINTLLEKNDSLAFSSPILKDIVPSNQSDLWIELLSDLGTMWGKKHCNVTHEKNYSNQFNKRCELWLNKMNRTAKNKSLNKALYFFKLADKMVDYEQTHRINQSSKIVLRKTSQNFYEKAIHTSMLSNNFSDMFYYMEKNKAMLLQESLLENEAKNKGLIPDSLRHQKANLTIAINDLEQQLKSQHNDSLRKMLFDYKSTLFNVKKEITQYLPNVRQKLSNSIISLDEVQANLDTNTAILEYSLFDNLGFILYISKNKVIPYKIGQLEDLKQNAKQLSDLLNEVIPNHYTTIAHKCFKKVIPPIIANELSNKNLIIIPDGFLNTIPFEALITNNDKSTYLLEQNEISYGLSYSFHKKNHSSYSKSYDLVSFAPNTFPNQKLCTLSYTQKEISAIQHIIPSQQSYTGAKATKSEFLQQINKHNIIHLATHAEANDTISPWIAFYKDKLKLEELYLTQNKADLIVLSACKTNSGTFINGEGVMSLSRGFFQTGTRSVISTLWNIDDEATSSIMASFYSYINQGKSKATALRQAKLDYLHTVPEVKRSPYFWASFVLIGNTNSIAPSKTISWYYYIGGGIILLIVLVLLLKYIKKSRLKRG